MAFFFGDLVFQKLPDDPALTSEPARTLHRTRAESIINPDAPLALRLSGQLMLGVVRIYSRKVNYLFQDCSEAMVKIKSAFTKADAVDLPEGQETAPLGLITLPENYDDLEVFFDPAAAASFGHIVTEEGYMQMSTSDASKNRRGAGDASTANKEDITLEDEAYEEWDNNFAYDDRIDGDFDGDDPGFSEDEDGDGTRYAPASGGFRTPGTDFKDPKVTDPNARVETAIEDYDVVDPDDAAGKDGVPAFDDEDERLPGGDGGEEVAPLPLEDDLEDADGVRGTLPSEQFKTPGPGGAKGAEGGAEGGADGEGGPGTPPASEPTTTPGIVAVEWGKAHQRNKNVEGKAKRAAAPRRKAKVKPIIDEVTMLTNEQIKAQLADTSDIVVKRGPGAVYKMADPGRDDDVPFGAPEYEDEDGKMVMYWREGSGGRRSRPPPKNPHEVHGIFWGTEYRRDPLFGDGRISEKLWNIRRQCVEHLWKTAGEKWGAGYAAFQLDKRGRGMSKVQSQWEDGTVPEARRFKPRPPRPTDRAEGDDAERAPNDDGEGAMYDDIPPPMMDDGGGSEFGGGGDDGYESRGAPSEGIGGGGLASEPATRANAPKGDADWSTHTKRMLARLRPKLLEKAKGRGKSKTAPVVKMSEITKIRGEDNVEKECSRAEAARLFYQVLVLKTHGFVDVNQPESYGDVDVTAGPKIREDSAELSDMTE